MSKGNRYISPCPFCGHEVERLSCGRAFRCTNGKCDALIVFDNARYTDAGALRAYNTRASCGGFTYALMGAALVLIVIVLTLALSVTERAENVSRETYASQTQTEQAAAEEQPQTARLIEYPAEEYANRLYTDADAQALAQMAWGESRGVASLSAGGGTVSPECQQAAAMWCVLNRYDAGFAGDSIAEIVSAPRQFHGYAAEHPVDEGLLALAYDVLDRWQAEKLGAADVGRVLPAEYLFFVGDGNNNHFTAEYGSGVYYTWELQDVYAEG